MHFLRFFFYSQGIGEGFSEESDLVSCGPVLAKKTMVSSTTEVVSRCSESASVKTGPSSSACLVSETSQCQLPSSFSIAIIRQQAEEAGL